GGLWMSVILKPQIPPTQAFRVNMAASVAVARALGGLYDLDVRIKWPNDIMVGDKKISGILTEIGADMDCLNYAVVGIGINANIDQQSLPEEGRATSISRELGRDVLLVELASRVLAEVERCSGDLTSSFYLIHLEWSQRSATLGRRVRIATRSGEFEGMAVDLDADGALLVERDGGQIERVVAGDCVHLRPSE
ncbi:MAG: biotin--[acetyl-CoA-carboxylase] ligase, partial [Methanothrix sp.]